jgi:hypothetical protein
MTSDVTGTEVMGTTMCARYSNGLLLVVHNHNDPAAAEWAAYCELAARLHRDEGYVHTLVSTPGAAPNASQRNLYKEKVPPNKVAVVTDSTLSRAAVTAMSWFNSNLKAFRSNQFNEALAHLGVAKAENLHTALGELQRHLGMSPASVRERAQLQR